MGRGPAQAPAWGPGAQSRPGLPGWGRGGDGRRLWEAEWGAWAQRASLADPQQFSGGQRDLPLGKASWKRTLNAHQEKCCCQHLLTCRAMQGEGPPACFPVGGRCRGQSPGLTTGDLRSRPRAASPAVWPGQFFTPSRLVPSAPLRPRPSQTSREASQRGQRRRHRPPQRRAARLSPLRRHCLAGVPVPTADLKPPPGPEVPI